ncbi:MAG: hypothetical protein ACK55I_37185, partial [bacterium]
PAPRADAPAARAHAGHAAPRCPGAAAGPRLRATARRTAAGQRRAAHHRQQDGPDQAPRRHLKSPAQLHVRRRRDEDVDADQRKDAPERWQDAIQDVVRCIRARRLPPRRVG